MSLRTVKEMATSTSWPANRVVRMPTARLIPYARNARIHSDAQVAGIAASIREWGFTVPVLVDQAGTVIAGHGRLLAAHKLGLETVPTMMAKGWSENQNSRLSHCRQQADPEQRLGRRSFWRWNCRHCLT